MFRIRHVTKYNEINTRQLPRFGFASMSQLLIKLETTHWEMQVVYYYHYEFT
jgi:hypothetical protein